MSDEDLNDKVVSLFGEHVRKPKDPIEEITNGFNEKYGAITIGPGFWILKEENDDVDFMTRKAFVEKHENLKHQTTATSGNGNVTLKDVPWTKIWLESPKRRTFSGIAFDPSNKVGPKIYNTWKGFAIGGIQGECQLVLDYIRNVICSKDDTKYQVLMSYLAHMVQRPWEKPEYAIALIGMKGVGKTFFLDMIETLIDGRNAHMGRARHCYKTSNSEDIYGRFRDHLQSKIALLLEEVTWGGDKRHEGTLKDYITGKSLKAERKNGPIISMLNVMRIIMAANPGWVVPASHDERRYMVLHVNNEFQQNHEHFATIQSQLNGGGYEALMYVLEHWDISEFNCREALRTEALDDQIKKSFNLDEKWWDDLLMSGQVQFIESASKMLDDQTINICIGREILRQHYEKYVRKINSRATLLTKTEFGIKLREYLPLVEGNRIVMNVDGRRVMSIVGEKRVGKEDLYCYILPSLSICRALWDFRLKRKFSWPEPVEWEQPEYSVM